MGETVQPGRPVRVCFVAPKSYPLFNPRAESVFGGAEVDLYYLGTELAKDARFEVSFVVADYGQSAEETRDGCRLIRSVDFRRGAVGGAWRVWRALKRADADVYMMKTFSAGVPLVALFCRAHGRAFFYRTATAPECDGTFARQRPLVGRLFHRSLAGAARIYVQSEADGAALRRTIGRESIFLPNGHPMPPLGDAPRETVLWVGRSTSLKQPELFLDLAERFPGRKFTMICQRATEDRDYDVLVERARAIANVEFLERVGFHAIQAHYQRAMVFVNTSSAEGFPNTFIEACKAATPILSLNVNPDGFLERFGCGVCCGGDCEKLASELKRMLEGVRLLEMGHNARIYAEKNHDIQAVIRQYKEVLLETMAGRTRKFPSPEGASRI